MFSFKIFRHFAKNGEGLGQPVCLNHYTAPTSQASGLHQFFLPPLKPRKTPPCTLFFQVSLSRLLNGGVLSYYRLMITADGSMVLGSPLSEIKVVFESDDPTPPPLPNPSLVTYQLQAFLQSWTCQSKLSDVCPPRWEEGAVRTEEKQLKKTKPPPLIPRHFP